MSRIKVLQVPVGDNEKVDVIMKSSTDGVFYPENHESPCGRAFTDNRYPDRVVVDSCYVCEYIEI